VGYVAPNKKSYGDLEGNGVNLFAATEKNSESQWKYFVFSQNPNIQDADQSAGLRKIRRTIFPAENRIGDLVDTKYKRQPLIHDVIFF
jgi:hypothetical protein